MTKQKLAKIISYVSGMHTWLPFLLLVTIFKTGLSADQIKILLPSLFLINVSVPIGYTFIAKKLGKVSAWDLPKREERHTFLLVCLACAAVSIFLIYLFGNRLLFNLNIILIILVLIIVVITRFWKISLHTSMNTAASLVINYLFNWQLPILYLTIPLTAWARYTLGSHDIKQLIAGIVIPVTFILIAFTYLGYI